MADISLGTKSPAHLKITVPESQEAAMLRHTAISITPRCWFCGLNYPSYATECGGCNGVTIPTLWKCQKIQWTVFTFDHGEPGLNRNSLDYLEEALEILNEMDHVVIRIVFGNMKLLLRRHAHGEETVLSMDVRAVPSGSFSRYC